MADVDKKSEIKKYVNFQVCHHHSYFFWQSSSIVSLSSKTFFLEVSLFISLSIEKAVSMKFSL